MTRDCLEHLDSILGEDGKCVACIKNELNLLSDQVNWFDPSTHYGHWDEKDLITYPGNPSASHWLLKRDTKGPKADALCKICGHPPNDHYISRLANNE